HGGAGDAERSGDDRLAAVPERDHPVPRGGQGEARVELKIAVLEAVRGGELEAGVTDRTGVHDRGPDHAEARGNRRLDEQPVGGRDIVVHRDGEPTLEEPEIDADVRLAVALPPDVRVRQGELRGPARDDVRPEP